VFRDSDYSKMYFPIHGAKDYRKVRSVARLKTFKSLSLTEAQKKYIIYLYDKGSPLRSRQANLSLNEQKVLAAELAGYSVDDPELDKLFTNEMDDVVAAINEVLRVQHSRLFSLICTNMELFYEYQGKLLEKTSSEKGDKDLLQAMEVKSKLRKEMAAINEELDGYFLKFFGDDEKLEEKSVDYFTPEGIADKMR